MAWRNCNTSVHLINAINFLWPGRDKSSDGTIGDAAHATRSSDHNPWIIVAGVGVVRARDIDKDGIPAAEIAERLRKMGEAGDPRLANGGYVIYNRRITSPDFKTWRVYKGSNPHTKHIHVSFSTQQSGFDSNEGWQLLPGLAPGTAPSAPVPSGPPAAPSLGTWPGWMPSGHYFGLKSGPAKSHGGANANERAAVKAIQQRLIAKGYVPGQHDWRSGWADGLYEKATVDAVARFQRAEMPGTKYLGQIWRDDWARLAR